MLCTSLFWLTHLQLRPTGRHRKVQIDRLSIELVREAIVLCILIGVEGERLRRSIIFGSDNGSEVPLMRPIHQGTIDINDPTLMNFIADLVVLGGSLLPLHRAIGDINLLLSLWSRRAVEDTVSLERLWSTRSIKIQDTVACLPILLSIFKRVT